MDDLQALTLLHRLGMQSADAEGLEAVLADVCDTAIALSGADFGKVQLLDAVSSELRIAAQRGFPAWWIEFWDAAAAGEGACGSALETGARIVVEDVEASPLFAGRPALAVQRRAGVRAVQCTPLLTREGKAVGVLSTHYSQPHFPAARELNWLDLLARQAADLIDSAQAAAALRASESRFRALSMAMAASKAVYVISADWSRVRFLEGNNSLFRAADADGDGVWLARHVEPVDLAQVSAAVQTAIATSWELDLEHRFRRPDGSIGWASLHAVPLVDAQGQITEWFAVASDVTQAHRATAGLHDEQQRLKALLEALPVGVAFTDSPDCAHVSGNPALLAQFGATPQDNVSASAPDPAARGRQIAYFHEGRPISQDQLPLQRAAREGRTIEPMELLVRLGSGKEFSLEVSGPPFATTAASSSARSRFPPISPSASAPWRRASRRG